jgi:hypothetical protein
MDRLQVVSHMRLADWQNDLAIGHLFFIHCAKKHIN